MRADKSISRISCGAGMQSFFLNICEQLRILHTFKENVQLGITADGHTKAFVNISFLKKQWINRQPTMFLKVLNSYDRRHLPNIEPSIFKPKLTV